MARVVCLACRREEDWSPEGGVTVVQIGGHRRSEAHPQWIRGRTALRAWAGEVGPVVGVCEGCGQLLVAEEPGPRPIAVRIDTPGGPLHVDRVISGPVREMTREEAEAFLDEQYVPSIGERARGWAAELPRLTLFLGMLGPAVFLLGGVLVVMSFFWALAVQGVPGEP